ncbi:unnamed protein product, partial [Discosporangium mesarthrocarpum]
HLDRHIVGKVFRLKLTPQELGAAIKLFDKDGDGMISCPEFLLTFFRVGFEEREHINGERKRRDREHMAKVVEEAERKNRDAEAKATIQVSHDYTAEDRDSAMAKIVRAATRYDKNHPSCLGLDAFEGAVMPPHVFKEQLKRVFGIRLSPEELGAVMDSFDKDRDGTVNCSEFLLTFFRVGFKEKNRLIQRRREESAHRLEALAREERQRLYKSEKRAQSALAPYTEKDLDDTLDLIITAASRYDRRNLGPAGLKAWEVNNMSPGHFKEQLKRTFDIRPTQSQMGATAHLFGTSKTTLSPSQEDEANGAEGVFGMSACIEVPEFLTTFFKISAATKGLTGKRDTPQKLREYRDALKARLAQQEEVRQTLKAMRENPPKRPFTVDSGLARAQANSRSGKWGRGEKGDTATQLRTRMAAARGTYRLDLSTWAERKQGDILLGKVPKPVFRLTFLTELWLTNNDLQMLPPEVRELRKLKTLGVGRNRITRQGMHPSAMLPGELGSLPELQRIFAEKNWLSTLPAGLANCRSLRELRLNQNQFSRLPDCIPELRGLEVLNLRGNSIEKLPLELKFLRSLLDLDLEDNPIGPEIPESILLLVNLARLSLAGTRIGREQGAIIEGRLRLDSLSVSPFVSWPPPNRPPENEPESKGGRMDSEENKNGRPVARVVSTLAAPVPEGRLPVLRDQVPGYNTRRLPGLNPITAETKAMMRAKAAK